MRYLSVLFLLCLSLPVVANGYLIIDRHDRRIRPPYPRVELRDLSVDVELDDRLAVTEVEHIFYNPGHRWQQGTFLFPLPKGATVESFTMWINGVETRGELLDAKKARRIYEDIVRNMKDPALLEYVGCQLFKASVFPIEARSEKKIRIAYRQIIERDDQLKSYVYPLRGAKFENGMARSFSMDVRLDTKKPISTLYSPSHDFDIKRKGRRSARLSFEERHFRPDRDMTLLFSSGEGLGFDMLTYGKEGKGHYWMTLMPDLSVDKVVPKDLVLVADTSGSMAGDKMDQLKAAMTFCVSNLGKEDRFQIIRFSTEAEAFGDDLMEATPENVRKARDFIDELRPIGGTNIQEALELALDLKTRKGRPQTVIFLSDGKPTIGARDESVLLRDVKEMDHGKRIFPVGIGFEVQTHLLDRLAEITGGQRTYVAPDEDLEIKLASLYNKLQAPVLHDPRLKVNGVTVRQQYPRRLPDLFRGSPLHLFGRYTGSGKVNVTLSGMVNGQEKTWRFKAEVPRREQENDFIPELWAQRRVGFLLDEIRLNGEDKELIDEVVALAKRYDIITPYTSYLILEDEAHRPRQRFGLSESFEANEMVVTATDYSQMNDASGRQSVATSDSASKLQQYYRKTKDKSQQNKILTKNALGRAFYQQGTVWMDPLLENHKDKLIQIQFSSDEYFELIKTYPELKEILSLGNNIQFVHEHQGYEILF